MTIIPILFLAVILVVVGQILVKMGINSMGATALSKGLLSYYFSLLTVPAIIAGTTIYGIATLLWLYILSKVDLSFAFPFVSLSYVIIVFSSWLFLGETITILRWTGVGVICFGIFLVTKS